MKSVPIRLHKLKTTATDMLYFPALSNVIVQKNENKIILIIIIKSPAGEPVYV